MNTALYLIHRSDVSRHAFLRDNASLMGMGDMLAVYLTDGQRNALRRVGIYVEVV